MRTTYTTYTSIDEILADYLGKLVVEIEASPLEEAIHEYLNSLPVEPTNKPIE